MGLDAYEYLGVINVYWCRTKNLVSIFELNGNNIIDAFLVDLRKKRNSGLELNALSVESF